MPSEKEASLGFFPQDKFTLGLFGFFYVFIFWAVYLTADPILFLSVTVIAILFTAFILRWADQFDVVLLLIFLFSIRLLYNHLGKWALLSGHLIVLWILILKFMMNRQSLWKDVLYVKPLLIFVGLIFLSLLMGIKPFNGIRLFVLNLIFGLMIFFMTHAICSDLRKVYCLIGFLVLFHLVNAVFGIFYYLQTGYRATSLFVDSPTYSGNFYVHGICLALGVYFASIFQKKRKFLFIVIGIFVTALFLSITRSAWLAFIFLGMLVLLFGPISRKYVFYGLVTTIFIVIFVLVFLSSDQLIENLQDRLTTDIQTIGYNMGSIASRFLLWGSAWQIFLDYPIMGIGYDNFVELSATTHFFPILQALGEGSHQVHNIYLQLLAETGIIGFLVFVALVFAIFRKIFQMWRSMENHPYRYVLLGFAGCIALWLFMGLTEANLHEPITSGFFFFYIGVISAIHKLLKQERRLIEN